MSNTIPSVSPNDHPNYACVTDDFDGQYGCGIYSWHIIEADAQHNAKITGGRCVPVDYINGELLIPPLATNYIDRLLESHGSYSDDSDDDSDEW